MIQNNFNFIGRLVKDADYRTATDTEKNNAFASFDLAIDKQKDNVDFAHLIAWGNTADFISKHTSKGTLIAVTGRIDFSKREEIKKEDKSINIVVPSFIVEEIRLLSKPRTEE